MAEDNSNVGSEAYMSAAFQQRIKQKKRQDKRSDRALLFGCIILFMAFAVFLLFQRQDMQKIYLYPYPYQDIVARYSKVYGIDKSLVAGVIMTESKFKNDVHSSRGAIGLMQLMPDTASWIGEQLEDENFSLDNLHDPEINIQYGTWYLASLQDEFAGNDVLMLAAYNAGRGNVHEWMELNHWDMSFQDIDAIPYEETKEYVARVLKNKNKYDSLY